MTSAAEVALAWAEGMGASLFLIVSMVVICVLTPGRAPKEPPRPGS